MNTQLFIPKKIKVGYVERNDTYSKKLGYVIYYDNKNVLRKETSWNSWRDDKIPFDDFDNVPTSGFVLNKKAGGNSNYSWNQRQTYSRVFDPRGFEFEISIPNLLFILQECDCSKGKGLEGEFVYSWEGKELVLLPAQSIEYKQCLEYTELQSESIKAKDLKVGYTYMTNKQVQYVYLGKYDVYNYNYYNIGSEETHSKEFIFLDVKDINKKDYDYSFYTTKSLSTIKREVSETQIENFSEILDKFINSTISSPFSHFEYTDIPIETLSNTNYINFYVYNKTNLNKYNIYKSYSDKDITIREADKYYNWTIGKPYSISINDIIENYKIKYVVFKNNSKFKTL